VNSDPPSAAARANAGAAERHSTNRTAHQYRRIIRPIVTNPIASNLSRLQQVYQI
jgi:hypothetical protein